MRQKPRTRGLFRQQALTYLSTPEELDQALYIIAPRERIALVALLGLLIALICWLFLGEIPYTIDAQGLLTRNQSLPGQQNVILAPADGHILQILVSVGDLVQAGQSVATLTLADTGDVIEVKSLYTGRVNKIIAAPEAAVLANRSIMSLTAADNSGNSLEGILYVSFDDAQNIMPGMRALISPASISRQQFGYLMGEVISVGQFPSVDSFAQGLSQVNPVVEVRVRLDPNATNPSTYTWTVSSGPPSLLRAGTTCTGLIIRKQEHPINRILRFLDPHDYS